MKIRLLTPLLALLTTLAGHAHEVWIEDTPQGQLVVRFAEYGEDYEKSPGALDDLALPAAFIFTADGKPERIGSQSKSDHYLLTGLAPKDAAHLETVYAIRGGGDKPARKPFFYARWQPAGAGAAKPALNFDLVPTANPGEACVTFRGQPLAGAKVIAHLGDGTEKEIITGPDGLVRVPVESPGLYLLICKFQREPQAGFYGGVAYDTVSHNCSLAWRVAARKP